MRETATSRKSDRKTGTGLMIAIRFFLKKLTRGGVDLERLVEQVGVSTFNTAETKFGRTGTNTIAWKADGPYEVEITDYH